MGLQQPASCQPRLGGSARRGVRCGEASRGDATQTQVVSFSPTSVQPSCGGGSSATCIWAVLVFALCRTYSLCDQRRRLADRHMSSSPGLSDEERSCELFPGAELFRHVLRGRRQRRSAVQCCAVREQGGSVCSIELYDTHTRCRPVSQRLRRRPARPIFLRH